MIDPFIMQSLLADPPLESMASTMVERSFDYAEVAIVEREAEADMEKLRNRFDSRFQPFEETAKKLAAADVTKKATIQQMGQLDGLVDHFDRKALELAVKARKVHRKLEKSLKISVGLSNDRRSMLKRVFAKAREQDQHFLQSLLDIASILRIARANLAPDNGAGLTFDNADDLERYLGSIGA